MGENRKGSGENFSGFSALTGIIIGLVLILFPGALVRVTALLLALICAVFGVLRIRGGLRGGRFLRGSIVTGVIAMIFGLYISLHAEKIASLLPFAAGILFLADGAGRVGTALSLRAGGAKRWWGACVFGALLCAAGIFLLAHPFSAVTATLRIAGIFVLIDGLCDLWSNYEFRRAAKGFGEAVTHRPADGRIEGQFRDISDE